MALCQMLAQLRDKNGRVNIPGFYDDVAKLSALERKQAARIPMTEAQYRKFLGVPKLFGERGYTFVEQRSARPTIEINGLTSGYQGEGSKTIVPSWARAKLTFRLVPEPGAGTHPKIILTEIEGALPANGENGSRGRTRRRAVYGVAHQPAGPGGAADIERGLRPRTDSDA